MDRHAGSNKENKDKELSHKPIIAKMAVFGNMRRERSIEYFLWLEFCHSRLSGIPLG
jgi:hypothetical protein